MVGSIYRFKRQDDILDPEKYYLDHWDWKIVVKRKSKSWWFFYWNVETKKNYKCEHCSQSPCLTRIKLKKGQRKSRERQTRFKNEIFRELFRNCLNVNLREKSNLRQIPSQSWWVILFCPMSWYFFHDQMPKIKSYLKIFVIVVKHFSIWECFFVQPFWIFQLCPF